MHFAAFSDKQSAIIMFYLLSCLDVYKRQIYTCLNRKEVPAVSRLLNLLPLSLRLKPVSYTHLDVYKRQLVWIIYTPNVSGASVLIILIGIFAFISVFAAARSRQNVPAKTFAE